MPRVLITGAAGFIGMHTAIRFIKEGWDVIGIDNINDYYSVKLKLERLKRIEITSKEENQKFIFFKADLNSNVWSDLDNIEITSVVHLAAQAGVRYSLDNPIAYIQSNILGFQAVLDFVCQRQIESFVYASSSSVYGKSAAVPFKENDSCNTPESYYAATKKANEMMAHSYFKTCAVRSLGLRFFTVYGPWGRPDMAPFLFVDAALKGNQIEVFNYGNQKRDFTYISDIVEGIYLSIKNFELIEGAEILNVGNGLPHSLKVFINTIEESTGKIIKKKYVKAQKGDVEITYASIAKIQSKFQFEPSVSLKEGMIEFVNWFRSYHAV